MKLLLSIIVISVLSVGSLSIRAESLLVEITTEDGEPIADAVVEVMVPESIYNDFNTVSSAEVDQIDKEFVPTVSTVVAGSEVSFPNSDEILHHVYSFSPVKTFNIPLYGRGENDDYSETFDQPGVVEIGCNIHDWMLAYIYVGETNLMTVSDASGQALVDLLPSGEYEIKVWHPRLATEIELHSVTIGPGVDTNLQIQLELARDRRVRRAPSANRNRYR